MSRRIAALRILLAVAAVSAIAACASPTAPTSPRTRSITVNHDLGDSATCRSGYSTGTGFKC